MDESIGTVLMVLESVFPSEGGGGAESQVRTLAGEFVRRGQPVRVIVPMVADGPQLAHEQIDGIPVTRLWYPRLPLLGALWLLASLAWLLVRTRRDYAVVHAHIAGNMAAVSSVLGCWLGKPVLVKLTGMTEMRGGILDPLPDLGARVRRRAMRSSTAYHATSRRIAALLVERGFEAGRVLHLPNAVDLGRFAQARRDGALRERLCGASRRVGVFVGRLEPEKGLETLIDAWARAFAGRDDVSLLLVGSGTLEATLRRRARAQGVERQLVFVGPTGEVERYLALADFGVLASQFEGLSNAMLEYMAARLPVVGSRISGTEDWVVDGQTGWSFPPGDVDALAAALAQVAQCEAAELRRRGGLAHERVSQMASIPQVTGALQAAYRRLALQRCRAPAAS